MKAIAIPRTLKYYRVATGTNYRKVFYPRGELIAVTAPDKKLLELVVKKMVKREVNPRKGRCKFCGCTWGRACEGGCGWANLKHTVCTNCSAFNGGQ